MAPNDFAISRSRPQFALLLLLLDLLKSGRVVRGRDQTVPVLGVCEPLFTPGDVALAKHFGFALLENTCGAYAIDDPLPIIPLPKLEGADTPQNTVEGSSTLMYMPHCPKELYANALMANWAPAGLSRLIIIGNSFEEIAEAPSTPSERLKLKRIHESRAVTSTTPFPIYDDDHTIFNSTAVHTFLDVIETHTDPAFWAVSEEERKLLQSTFTANDPKP